MHSSSSQYLIIIIIAATFYLIPDEIDDVEAHKYVYHSTARTTIVFGRLPGVDGDDSTRRRQRRIIGERGESQQSEAQPSVRGAVVLARGAALQRAHGCAAAAAARRTVRSDRLSHT